MKPEFAVALRCPSCRVSGRFSLAAEQSDAVEVRDGMLTCEACGERRTIRHGIVDLLPRAVPDFVARESAGLDRFAQKMRDDGWDRERVLELPYHQSGYWYMQATSMHQVLNSVALRKGQRILDVGSNTCWASAMFAERGLSAVALDINAAEMQGLGTADWWRDAKGVHLERVLGLMFDVPVVDGWFDWVWCCEVLHHNHRANLRRTFSELFRVLKPGGAAIVVNEPLRSLREPHWSPGSDVAEYDGHEHVYIRHSYVRSARRAGFSIELRGSWDRRFFSQEELGISRRMTTLDGFRAAGYHAVRRNRLAQASALAWQAYVQGGTPLIMIARKPG